MGSLWMLAAGAAFAIMGVFVKLGAQRFASHELVFWRSALGLLLLAAMLSVGRRHRLADLFAGGHLGLHLRRGLVGFVALLCYFFALTRLPLSVAITLNYTSPLFLALIMPWWLDERPRPAQYLAVAAGFGGVVLLLRPWDAQGDLLAGLLGLFSGAMAALAYAHVRQLGRLHEPEWRTVFWFAGVASLGALLCTIPLGWQTPVADDIGWLLGLALFATLGQLAMTRAYRTGDTVVVAGLAYSTVVFGSLLDAVIWHVQLPWTAWTGTALTIAAGIWAVRLDAQERR